MGATYIATVNLDTDDEHRPDAGCSSLSVSISYIALPASSVTKTVYVPSQTASPVQAGSDKVASTFASLLTSTQVITLAHATGQPGPYSFTEANGTTIWLGGKTPPLSAKLVTSTSVITLHPVSTQNSGALQGGSVATTTSYLTLTPTETITQTYTKILTQHTSSVATSPKGYPPYGLAGWNTSVTLPSTLGSATAGGALIQSSVQVSVSRHSTSQNTAASIMSTAYGRSRRHLWGRQAGDFIEATIDGVLVSWVNNYNGIDLTVSEEESTLIPTTATAPAFASASSGEFGSCDGISC